MYTDIVIIGTGGFAREVLTLLTDINRAGQNKTWGEPYNILGFLDNDSTKWGTRINGLKVLGGDSFVKEYYEKLHQDEQNDPDKAEYLAVAIGIGSPTVKKSIVFNLDKYCSFPNLVHPNVIGLPTYKPDTNFIKMGEGNIITAGNILTCNITIGNHVMLNLAGTIGHDCVIEDYVVVSPGVNLSGNCNVGEGAYLGTGSTILEKKNIGAGSVVGAGAVVTKDVPENTTVVGNPAKPLVKS